MKTELLIHGHGGAQGVFDMIAPLWLAHGLPITVFCSENDPLKTDLPLKIAGKSGPNAYERWIRFLVWIVDLGLDCCVIFEYDSFCLSKVLPPFGRGLFGCTFCNMEGACWVAHQYPGHPIGIDAKSAEKMLAVAYEYPEMTEEGFVDRLYAALAQLAGVPIMPWRNATTRRLAGFCRNTIEPSDYDALRSAIHNGVRWVHGTKSQESFDVCMQAMRGLE